MTIRVLSVRPSVCVCVLCLRLLVQVRRKNLPEAVQSESVLELFNAESQLRRKDGRSILGLFPALGDVGGEHVLGLRGGLVDLVNLVHGRDRGQDLVVTAAAVLIGKAGLFRLVEIHPEDRHRGIRLVQGAELLVDLLQLLLGIDPEAENISPAHFTGLHDQSQSKLGFAKTNLEGQAEKKGRGVVILDTRNSVFFSSFFSHGSDLQEGDGDVEQLVHVRVPDEPDVGDDGRAEIALVRGQVPDAVHRVYDRLLRKNLQMFLDQDRAAQFQLSVELGRGVGLEHSDDRGEQSRVAGHEVGEDELEPGVVALGQDVEGLGQTTELGVDRLGRDVQYAVVADSWKKIGGGDGFVVFVTSVGTTRGQEMIRIVVVSTME